MGQSDDSMRERLEQRHRDEKPLYDRLAGRTLAQREAVERAVAMTLDLVNASNGVLSPETIARAAIDYFIADEEEGPDA